jgi:alkanesulfonate monooxygenase SsuD/methylene tetrahydromethanopterin reductase-like flavin-dependent oxidoreductase (luciferase family)
VVAEQFGTLEALHRGRIDLGIGRAPGTDQLTALALRRTVAGLSAESRWLDRPLAMVAVSAICADTDERARWLSGPARLSFLRLRAGRPQPLATPEEAAARPFTPAERQIADERLTGQAIGSPDTVARQLAALAERTAADELMLTTMVYDITARTRSFELITAKVLPHLPAPPS